MDFNWMKNYRIKKVIFSEPNLWVFSFDDNKSAISVQCPWRIIYKDRIVLCNEDHQQSFGHPNEIDATIAAENLIENITIESVELKMGTLDIIITLEGNKRIEIIPFSSGYESWSVHEPSKSTVIAQGGGNLVILNKNDLEIH